MGKIRILSDNLVSKIAAGEIVERPASVVKELIENSLDAGSTQIHIELESGGKKLIRVIDNGHGMSRDDALMSLERHATSKIKAIEDLFSVSTLGFRGEALPSIASVSRFKMTSRASDNMSGCSILIEGGKIRRVDETGCPEGTTVEVRRLFYNTPARLKFMRKIETETINVLGVVERAAVAHPETGFILQSDERILLELPMREDSNQRVKEIYRNARLFSVSAEGGVVSVRGYMSGPLDARSSAQKVFTYVNSRAVKDRFITRMVIDAYGKMLEKYKYPQGAIFVQIPNELVDVNVHPTKSEVRFKDTRLVGDIIKSAILKMLEQAPWISIGGIGNQGIVDRKGRVERAVSGFMENRSYDRDYQHSRFNSSRTDREFQNRAFEAHNSGYTFNEEILDNRGFDNNTVQDDIAGEHQGNTLFTEDGFYSSLKVIGQLGELYILCASQNGMILVDQHAAHERINYERIKKAYAASEAPEVQELLVPETVELSAYEAGLLQSNLDELSKLGLRVEKFGERAFIIRSVPALFSSYGCEGLLKDIVSEIAGTGKEESLTEKIERIISTMACHSSVRANQELNIEKMEVLLKELDRMDFPHSCPHGRPVARELTYYEIERMFKRT